MALKLSAAQRNARLDAMETEAGTGAILEIRSGSAPADAAASRTGTVLVTMTLPSDWLGAASGGVKSKSGTWEDTSADASGTAGYFTIYKSDGTTVCMQGTVTATGGGGDLTLTTTTIVAGQPVTITAFAITDGNA